MSANGDIKNMFATMSQHADSGPTSADGDKATKSNKRLSVERIYQKKTQLEHILLRPDSYIGSTEAITQAMWVMSEEDKMIQREITYVPGLYKIFDEILVNAADNKQRDAKMNTIKIDINPESNYIKIWNNGKGIPIVEHQEHNMYIPEMIFGHLLTSSNYDDSEQKVTGGRNGFGAKLCNIYSEKFVVETVCNEYKKSFKQTWTTNMTKTKPATIGEPRGDDFTAITFYPDLKRFKMEKLNEDVVALFTRRAYDVAASLKHVKVMLNGKRLPVKNFQDYVNLYIKDQVDETGSPLTVVYEQVNDRWEVAVTLSEKGFQQVSFVNSISTTKGGRHVDYITDQVVAKLIDIVKKKDKGGIAIKPFQIKTHLWIFINAQIVNPSFDSQTKENLNLQMKSFGSKCQLSDTFIKKVTKSGIVESILSWMKFKAQTQMSKKIHGAKQNKLKGIPKLDDANDAGTKNSLACTLILTEGDSAKTLAVSGLGIIGRDRFGVFPLRGKVLNVREATHKQILDNAEISNLVKICGLQFKEKYSTPESMKSLRYGKIMIMTDQDQDGSHIKGLLINLIHHFWPNLLKYNFLEEFITPIVKVSKNKNERSFYSLPEFGEWKSVTDNWHTFKIKYYKGLGTSTSKEAKEYFSDMKRHKIPFKYGGPEDEAAIVLAFSKKKTDERKEWMTNWMDERKRRAELGLPELYLYGKETRNISYSDFVNRELILFSNTDLERSIPSLVDGLKPGQRKVIFTCLKRNDKKEVKVAQLAGSVGEQSAYHHGEASLMSTIIALAQNYVGSNNLNLLLPIGQFGTRLHGGKDAASPRYIFTMLSPLARHIFNPHDTPLLKAQYDDNQKIEPEWYMPIIPLVLVNGAEGIGTGWSTKIPNFDIRAVVANLRRLLAGDEPEHMIPSYKNFRGSIEELSSNRYYISGEVGVVDDDTLEITELPIRTWTQSYKEEVLEPMLHGTEKVKPVLQNYNEYHTDTTVKFVVKVTPQVLNKMEDEGLHKAFKLQTALTTNSLVLFDPNGCVRTYANVMDILREFFNIRLTMYVRRKAYLEGLLKAESLRLDNIARFIVEKIKEEIKIENLPRKELVQLLIRRGYDSDPLKAWKSEQDKNSVLEEEAEADSDAETQTDSQADFNYILSMALWSLTRERKDELLKQKEAKSKELAEIKKKTHKEMYRNDLDAFMEELEKVEAQERQDVKLTVKTGLKQTKLVNGRAKFANNDSEPSKNLRRVEPAIDQDIRNKHLKEPGKRGARKKEKEEDVKQRKIEDFLGKDSEEVDEKTLSLADRVKPKVAAKKASGEAKKQASPKKSSPKKKGNTRNPWSSGSEKSDSNLDSDGESEGEKVVIPRETGPRRQAAKTIKYNVEDDQSNKSLSSDEDPDIKPTAIHSKGFDISDDEIPDTTNTQTSNHKEDVVLFDSDVDDASDRPPSVTDKNGYDSGSDSDNTAKDTKKHKMISDDSDDSFMPQVKKPPAKKKLASKTAAPEPIVFNSDSERDSDGNDLFKSTPQIKKPAPAKKAPATKKPPAKKGAAKTKPVDKKQPTLMSTLNKAKAKPAAKKPAAPIDLDSDDSDDSLKGKKPAEKKPPTNKRTKTSQSSSDSSDTEKNSTANKKAKRSKSDSDDSFNTSDLKSRVPLAQRVGRARAAVKYFASDNDESASD